MEKEYLLCFLLAQILKILKPQARDGSLLSMAIWKNLMGSISFSLVSILCVWIMSPLYLLSISVVSAKASSLSSKDLPFSTGIILVAIFWTPSIKFIMSCLYGIRPEHNILTEVSTTQGINSLKFLCPGKQNPLLIISSILLGTKKCQYIICRP
ncbi:unnamed protein product [Meganyctiphanes norvegica]